jgi:hypothetical protein
MRSIGICGGSSGSDQTVWPAAIGIAIEPIQSAGFLTEAQKHDILHDQAARFPGPREAPSG